MQGFRESPIGFSGAARVEKGVPKGTDVFLNRFECLLQVEVFEEHTRMVAFWVGSC
jgi:hypothetical protein